MSHCSDRAANVPCILDLTQAVCAARCIIVPLNTRNTPDELAYVLEHSGSRLLIVDSEYAHLVKGSKVPTIIADDSRPPGDAYEALLAEGRRTSGGTGFSKLTLEPDEHAGVSLCYTVRSSLFFV